MDCLIWKMKAKGLIVRNRKAKLVVRLILQQA